jgi:hypothetical protein
MSNIVFLYHPKPLLLKEGTTGRRSAPCLAYEHKKNRFPYLTRKAAVTPLSLLNKLTKFLSNQKCMSLRNQQM